MKKIFACAAIIALAACSQEPAPEPQPVETAVAEPVIEPTLPAPDEAVFAEVYAEACPDAKPVSTSLCRSEGMGKPGFICDYGLGNDEYRRHKVNLIPGDGKWAVVDPENTCVAG